MNKAVSLEKKISQQEIDEILTKSVNYPNYYNNEKNCINFKKQVFEDNIKITKILNGLSILFEDCKIKNLNIEIPINVSILNCKNVSEINLKNENKSNKKIINIQIEESNINRLNISNLNIKELLIINDNYIDYVSITQNSFSRYLDFSKNKSKIESSRIEIINNLFVNCNLIQVEENKNYSEVNFKFNKNDLVKKLLIKDNTITKKILLYELNSKEADIVNNESPKCLLELESIKTEKLNICNNNVFEANFSHCEFIEESHFIDNIVTGKFELKKNIFNKRLKISSSKIKKIDNEKEEEIINGEISELLFEDNKINSLRIGHQNIDTLKIENISNFEPNSEINIGSLIINKELNIHKFRNTSQMRLYKINENINTEKSNSKLIISNSTFGSAEFQEINFNSFQQVQIYSSNLTNIEMIDINWPDEITPSEDKNSLEQLRNTYRMLKYSCMRQEDRIQALKFYSKEMETHRELIGKNEKSNWAEIFILGFNDWTSNFGLKWTFPLYWILGINILFLAIYFFIGSIQFNFELFLTYIQMLNPLFNIERIGINKWNELIYTLDIIRKIIFGIFLYQLIVAFRKYSRKI